MNKKRTSVSRAPSISSNTEKESLQRSLPRSSLLYKLKYLYISFYYVYIYIEGIYLLLTLKMIVKSVFCMFLNLL